MRYRYSYSFSFLQFTGWFAKALFSAPQLCFSKLYSQIRQQKQQALRKSASSKLIQMSTIRGELRRKCIHLLRPPRKERPRTIGCVDSISARSKIGSLLPYASLSIRLNSFRFTLASRPANLRRTSLIWSFIVLLGWSDVSGTVEWTTVNDGYF